MIFLFLLVTSGCKNHSKEDLPEIVPEREVSLELFRFEKETIPSPVLDSAFVLDLNSRSGGFFDLFCQRILNVREPDPSLMRKAFGHFIHDRDIMLLTSKSDSVYADFSACQNQISESLSRLHSLLPDWKIPSQLITFISAFNYRIITSDSLLAVALDMFLGGEKEEEMYASVGFPKYMLRKFSPEYLAVDALRGWIQSELPEDSAGHDLISLMIYKGKVQYLLGAVFPDLPDSILFGYTHEQMKWCEQEEANIWAYLIDKDLLFNSQQQQISRFINDGPTTSGMPKESPGSIGLFVGYKIVVAYLKKNKIPADEFLNNFHAHEILRQSGYKP
ncbi:MAG: hypothetical protein LC117_11420 [Bacteroidia bacterium]|nr:hypothetical protein [Bacteroidia bacterium]MCZ2278521.1 hypothetical protein [Bacteroidia bacterium]